MAYVEDVQNSMSVVVRGRTAALTRLASIVRLKGPDSCIFLDARISDSG